MKKLKYSKGELVVLKRDIYDIFGIKVTVPKGVTGSIHGVSTSLSGLQTSYSVNFGKYGIKDVRTSEIKLLR